MLAVDEDDFSLAVEQVGGSAAVIDEAGFVAKASGVDYALVVEIEGYVWQGMLVVIS